MIYRGRFGIATDGTNQRYSKTGAPLHSQKKVIRCTANGSFGYVDICGRGELGIHPIRSNGIATSISPCAKFDVRRQKVITVTPIKNGGQLQLFHITTQLIPCALSLALLKAGSIIAAKTAMMAITTNSSISVNALEELFTARNLGREFPDEIAH